MTGKTHIATGFLVASIIPTNNIGAILICAGSLLPDIDHGNAIIGKKFKFISKILKHRHFTHSIVFALICGVFSPYLAVGVMTHIIADMMTKQGVKLFYPIKRSVRLPLAKYNSTNSIFESVLRNMCFVICTIVCMIKANVTCAHIFNEIILWLNTLFENI